MGGKRSRSPPDPQSDSVVVYVALHRKCMQAIDMHAPTHTSKEAVHKVPLRESGNWGSEVMPHEKDMRIECANRSERLRRGDGPESKHRHRPPGPAHGTSHCSSRCFGVHGSWYQCLCRGSQSEMRDRKLISHRQRNLCSSLPLIPDSHSESGAEAEGVIQRLERE